MANEDVQNSEPTIDEMFDSVVDDANEPVDQVQQPQEPKTTEEQYIEYEALGATRKEPLDLVKKRASMGYDYAQKMEAFKQQQSEWEAKLKRAEELNSKFAHLDEYAQQNPEWYQHWSQAYENRQAGLNGEPNQEIQAIWCGFLGVFFVPLLSLLFGLQSFLDKIMRRSFLQRSFQIVERWLCFDLSPPNNNKFLPV